MPYALENSNIGFNSIITFHLDSNYENWKLNLYQYENFNENHNELPLLIEGTAMTYYKHALKGFRILSMKIEGSDNITVILSNSQKKKNAVFNNGRYPYLAQNENLREKICNQDPSFRECELFVIGIDYLYIILGTHY